MRIIKIRKGIDIPYSNSKLATSHSNSEIQFQNSQEVGLVGSDYPFKFKFHIAEGDMVKRGQKLFSDKTNDRIFVVSPVNGKVKNIHRGERRIFQSLIIQVSSEESTNEQIPNFQIQSKNSKLIKEFLTDKGAWVYLRTRPFSLIPDLDQEPDAIFINAMDTSPGSIGMKPLLDGREKFLDQGIKILSQLTKGKVFFCQKKEDNWNSITNWEFEHSAVFEKVAFEGKHPAGLSSTHIHFLRPASIKHPVWCIPATLVADIGELFITGILPNKKRVLVNSFNNKSLEIVETLLGAKVSAITQPPEDHRLIAGSILHGWTAENKLDYLGRFHNQISCLPIQKKREFINWLLPGWKRFSISRAYLGSLNPGKLELSTSLNGSERSMVPIGNYERVMPLDILPTQLLRSLLTKDWEEAIELGALELEEEDLSLCTFVCPGKMDYGLLLRKVLEVARKELV